MHDPLPIDKIGRATSLMAALGHTKEDFKFLGGRVTESFSPV